MDAQNTKSCPYCGEEVKAVANKCKHCREPLTTNKESILSSNPPEELPLRSKSNLLSTNGIIGLVFLGVFGVGLFLGYIVIINRLGRGVSRNRTISKPRNSIRRSAPNSSLISQTNTLASNNAQIKSDLKDYLDDLLNDHNFIKIEAQIIDDYDAVTGDNYKDDATTYQMVEKSLLPKCQKAIDILEALTTPKTPQINEIHELWIECNSLKYSALSLLSYALETQDGTQVVMANEKLAKSRKVERELSKKLTSLIKKYQL